METMATPMLIKDNEHFQTATPNTGLGRRSAPVQETAAKNSGKAEAAAASSPPTVDLILGSHLGFFVLFFFFIGICLAWCTWWLVRAVAHPDEGVTEEQSENTTFVCGIGS